MKITVSNLYHLKRFKLLLALVLVLITISLAHVSIFADLENQFLDIRFRNWSGDLQADSNIVIISIDDGSLDYFAENGTAWPWPRSFYAYLVDYLNSEGASVIIFDMLFTHFDADRSETDAEETDGAFAEALRNNDRNVLGMIIDGHAFEESEPDHELIQTGQSALNNALSDSLLEIPIQVLSEACSWLGHTNISPDRDGIFRHIKPFTKVNEQRIPSLASAAYLIIHPEAKVEVLDQQLQIDELVVPLVGSGDLLINWYGEAGPSGVFTYLPFSSVIQSASAIKYGGIPSIQPGTFNNKIVIIGADAAGLRDLKATPILRGGLHPGMEVWATVLSNFTQNDFIYQFPKIPLFLILFGMGFVILYSFDHLKVRFAFPIILLQLLLYLLLAYLLWSGDARILLPLVPPLLVSTLAYIIVFSNEMRERLFMKRVFGPYISPELMQLMYQTREAPSLGGEQITGTAFFSDLQGFTRFSEKLTPVKLVALLNEYLTVMTDSLMELRGTLDKYEGDAIIAFFGAPVADEEHAHQGVKAAITMQRGLADLRKKWESEGDDWPEEIKDLQMRIGINSGEMLVGNVGSKGRMNFTMMGDTVNVAARLESSAKQYGVLTQISEVTARQMPPEIILRRLGATQLVGKSRAAVSYEVFGYAQDLSQADHELLQIWPKALTAINDQDWDLAESLFQQTLALERQYAGRPTNPSQVYLDIRIPNWREQELAADWEAVWVFDSK